MEALAHYVFQRQLQKDPVAVNLIRICVLILSIVQCTCSKAPTQQVLPESTPQAEQIESSFCQKHTELPQRNLPEALLTLSDKTTIRARVADTAQTRQFGLMCERQLANNEGMLFLFEHMRVQSFWMKNTLIPLDMIFIDENGIIVGIIEDAKPLTTTSRTVGTPSQYVLELKSGQASAFGLRKGQHLTWIKL